MCIITIEKQIRTSGLYVCFSNIYTLPYPHVTGIIPACYLHETLTFVLFFCKTVNLFVITLLLGCKSVKTITFVGKKSEWMAIIVIYSETMVIACVLAGWGDIIIHNNRVLIFF